MSWSEYFNECRVALRSEIAELKKNGSSKIYTTTGTFLSGVGDSNIYSFDTDTEIRLPDDIKVGLEIKKNIYPATIVSIEGFKIVLSLSEYVGNNVDQAVIYAAPWFILEELSARLTELERDNSKENKITSKLLLNQLPSPTDWVTTWMEQFLRNLSDEKGNSVSYNQSQAQALSKAMSQDITFVWGPPGTGKTKTLGMLAAAMLNRGESVLLVAHSNSAVDVAMAGIGRCTAKTTEYSNGRILRYGIVANKEELESFPLLSVKNVAKKSNPDLIRKIDLLEKQKRDVLNSADYKNSRNLERAAIELKQIRDQLDPLLKKLRELETQYVADARVIGCTLSKAAISKEIYLRKFDNVLLDEASMAYIPHGIMVSGRVNKRLVFFGDFRQLAPIAKSATPNVQKWLKRDIFDYAKIIRKVESDVEDTRLALLKVQYRMHPSIASIPNRLFYKGKLENGPSLIESTGSIARLNPEPGQPVVLIDLTNLLSRCLGSEDNSRFNPISALVSAAICHSNQAGLESLGVVTPYKAQSRLINRMLKDLKVPKAITVATVHRFQGAERDVILFDSVDAPNKRPGKLFQSDAVRLVNVAVSRPKGKFVLLAHVSHVKEKFAPDSPLGKLINSTQNFCVFKPDYSWFSSEFKWASQNGLISYYRDCPEAREHLERQISEAKKSVSLSWPGEIKDFHIDHSVLRRISNNGLATYVRGEEAYRCLKNTFGLGNLIKLDGHDFPTGLISIDNSSLWIYISPTFKTNCNIINLRMAGTVGLINSFLQLVPDSARDSGHEHQNAAATSISEPFGRCAQCGTAMWPKYGRYGYYLLCQNPNCKKTNALIPSQMTVYAQLMGIKCDQCGSTATGRKGKSVFLSCPNYPKCNWSKSLGDVFG